MLILGLHTIISIQDLVCYHRIIPLLVTTEFALVFVSGLLEVSMQTVGQRAEVGTKRFSIGSLPKSVRISSDTSRQSAHPLYLVVDFQGRTGDRETSQTPPVEEERAK